MPKTREEECLEQYGRLLPNLADYVTHHARKTPRLPALIEHNTGQTVTWKQFERAVSAFAAKLLSLGLKKGDILATSLPLLKEHVFIMYACYRTGIIVAPLDLRLKAGEILHCMERMKPKAYFFLGRTPAADFRPLVAEVKKGAPHIAHWVQFQKEEDEIMDGAVGVAAFARDVKRVFLKSLVTGSVRKAARSVNKRDPCLIIFTTGSTGSPKPALLCHENILCQNIGLAVNFDMGPKDRMLVNLPPSHVGCVTEQLATTVYGGGTSVLLHVFDALESLRAVEKHRVTVLGQIPALFNMEWRLPDYGSFDLSSLRFAIYGGQAVNREFLEKMSRMAPQIGTGLGLTETGGFCTYTRIEASVDDLAEGIGFDIGLCPLTIRKPMKADGRAGDMLPQGEVGEICFNGPQIFPGYLNDPESTARTISKDGYCYTGDMGRFDEKGLHFAGRSKLIIKPKGFQVFPEDVENHIAAKLKGRVGLVGVVGAEHQVYSEGIVAFIETVEENGVTGPEVLESCADISAYSRPGHVEILGPGQMPLNRAAKTDYVVLRERAAQIVRRLRESGGWDAG